MKERIGLKIKTLGYYKSKKDKVENYTQYIPDFLFL